MGRSAEVAHINALTDAVTLPTLLKYDSTQGRFDGNVEVVDGGLKVNGKFIKVTQEKDPANLKWADTGVGIVLEATGFFTTKEKAELHLHDGGAKKVVITAPGGNNVKTIVFNTNHKTLDGTETVISAGSCTTNCLAPMAKVLKKNFGSKAGTMTTIHSYTSDQMILDGPHRKGNFRRIRASCANLFMGSSFPPVEWFVVNSFYHMEGWTSSFIGSYHFKLYIENIKFPQSQGYFLIVDSCSHGVGIH